MKPRREYKFKNTKSKRDIKAEIEKSLKISKRKC